MNNRFIDLEEYEETEKNGLMKVFLHFKVSHENYHDITTLLYKRTFDVEIPEKGFTFKEQYILIILR